jgi:hypothetical protein
MPELEHNRRLIENLAMVNEANAALHIRDATEQLDVSRETRKPRWSQHEMLAASGFVIAASYWSLVDPRRAVSLYRKAAETYRYLGHSYAMVLALASASVDDLPAMLSAIDETPSPSPQTIALAMVANEVSDSEIRDERAERLNKNWRHAGNVPIGRLGIPLDHYGRCARAMRDARRDKNVERLLGEGANYVHRAAEVLRSASHDRFNWLRLRSSILPAEPEAVAMTTAMSMMSHSLFRMPITKMPNLDSHGRLLVEVGDEMRKAAGGPETSSPPTLVAS